MSELLGREVLRSLYLALENQYDVTKDEVPCRIETAYKILRDVFGVKGAGTLSRRIVRRLYDKLDLKFDEVDGLHLMEYVDIAKRKLAQEETAERFLTKA